MSKAAPPNNYKILIIDDEKIILDLTSIILKNRGYTVFVSSDARTGLEIIDREKPELVLMDYMMPGMDGLTALQEIKSRFPTTYVIMFTGKGSEEIAVKLMKAGASDYVLKPFINQDLADRIANVLKIRSVELRNDELLREQERLLKEIETWNQELEARVEEKTLALQKAQAENLQAEKLATLGFLSAGMAHEVRNPLNSISLLVQLLKSGMEDNEKLEYVERILKEIDRIDSILTKLLNAAKRPRFELKSVDLHEMIESTIEMFQPQIERNGIEVIREYGAIPPAIQADPSELQQIFTNLFLNSIQEMPDGGVLTVALDVDGGTIVVRVGDTGSGIPPENLPNIFDPFFTSKSKGSGLGLSVVLRVVKTYKGRIEVEKTGEKGTTFCISLPVA